MKKRLLATLLVCAMTSVLLAGCGGQAAKTPEESAPAADDSTTETSAADDSAAEAPASAGGITVGMCPKLLNDGHLQAMGKGAEEAADELGYNFDFNGPANIDITEQIDVVNQMTQKGYTAILLSANDADALTPAMEAAKEAGVLTSTWDADVNVEARDCHMTQATAEDIGNTLGSELIRAGITSGEVLLLNATLTAPNQNAWLAACEAYLAENAPDIELLGNLPTDEDPAKARELTYNYLMSHPDTVHVLSLSAGALAGACEAIEQLNLDIKASGIFVPSLDADYLKSGTCFSGTLWDPVELGYCAMYMVKAQIEGTLDAAVESGVLDCGKYGEKKLVDKEKVIFSVGNPMVFTTENVDDFDF